MRLPAAIVFHSAFNFCQFFPLPLNLNPSTYRTPLDPLYM